MSARFRMNPLRSQSTPAINNNNPIRIGMRGSSSNPVSGNAVGSATGVSGVLPPIPPGVVIVVVCVVLLGVDVLVVVLVLVGA